jgi:nucleoid-associated protein YejK
MWGEQSGSYPAYKETVIVEIVSYGGDTTGYQIAFNVHYQGDRVKGTFDPATKTFTEASA